MVPVEIPADPFPLIGLSLLGLLISIYLLYNQRTGAKPLCIVGKNCDMVIKSRYAATMGVPNTILGILYYLFLISLPILRQAAPAFSGSLQLSASVLSAIASLFSLYLLYLQAFVLREWCDYCIASALVNFALFALFLTTHL